jgi:hypothetical protein
MQETLEKLRAFPSRLRNALEGVEHAALHKLEGEGRWSVADVAAHLGDLELVYAVRIRTMIAAGEDVPLPALAQNAWVERVHRHGETAAELLRNFEDVRRMNVELLARLDEEQLARTGTHPQYGRLSVRDAAERIVRHDQKHLAQIERVKRVTL